MKTALITGITGQDGSYLAELLLQKEYLVIGIKRRTSVLNTSNIDHLYENKNFKLECCKGHELVCANGQHNIPYFRHKNSNDVGGHPMSEWHSEWQSNFINTEIEFPKNNNQWNTFYKWTHDVSISSFYCNRTNNNCDKHGKRQHG